MIIDKLFDREGIIDIVIKCLKAKTKGESLDIMKEETKKFTESEKIEMAYIIGVIHGADEGVYNRKESEEFLKNLNLRMKLGELKESMNEKNKCCGG